MGGLEEGRKLVSIQLLALNNGNIKVLFNLYCGLTIGLWGHTLNQHHTSHRLRQVNVD